MDQVVKRSPNPQHAPAPAVAPDSRFRVKKPKYIVKAIILILVLLLVAGGGLVLKESMSNEFSSAVIKDRYQAVFLTNGQVYFGKIDKITNTGYTLKDIYYLQVQQGVQPETKKEGEDQNLSLAKLGSELHGPDDVMYIEGKQVLFWENLKTDSQVVKAISANKK